jgi:glutamine synthetase
MTKVEYVWLDGYTPEPNLRSKIKVIDVRIPKFSDIPEWNFDGSSTDQALSESDTEVILKPCAICVDPFRETPNILVLCDCYLPNGEPHSTNTRTQATKVFEIYKDQECWFGLEQEYILRDRNTGLILGWQLSDFSRDSRKYYCGNGADKIFARNFMEDHYQKCLSAGLEISGYNAEVMPGQYEYQIGPVEGISAADQLIFARYIMLRICETQELCIVYEPKPVADCNGSGLHHNFSTKQMREENGYESVIAACEKLKIKHQEHLSVYGHNNDLRLTGKHETSNMSNFTWGIGTRNTSVRIPNQTFYSKRGYLEDRRPAANADPYLSTAKLLSTCLE